MISLFVCSWLLLVSLLHALVRIRQMHRYRTAFLSDWMQGTVEISMCEVTRCMLLISKLGGQ